MLTLTSWNSVLCCKEGVIAGAGEHISSLWALFLGLKERLFSKKLVANCCVAVLSPKYSLQYSLTSNADSMSRKKVTKVGTKK